MLILSTWSSRELIPGTKLMIRYNISFSMILFSKIVPRYLDVVGRNDTVDVTLFYKVFFQALK